MVFLVAVRKTQGGSTAVADVSFFVTQGGDGDLSTRQSVMVFAPAGTAISMNSETTAGRERELGKISS